MATDPALIEASATDIVHFVGNALQTIQSLQSLLSQPEGESAFVGVDRMVGRWLAVLSVVYRQIGVASVDRLDALALFDALCGEFSADAIVVTRSSMNTATMDAATAFRCGLSLVQVGSLVEGAARALRTVDEPRICEVRLHGIDAGGAQYRITTHRIMRAPLALALEHDTVLRALCPTCDVATPGRRGATPAIDVRIRYDRGN